MSLADLGLGQPSVSTNQHAALIALQAATDADIKPVVRAVESANGSGGFAVAVTGVHTVGNDFSTLSTSDLQNGELDFGLPISIVILLLVFGAVVAGLMPMLMALSRSSSASGVATLVAQEFQPLDLHRQHDDRHGPGARDRLLLVHHLPLP